MKDFLTFKRMISPIMIQIVWWLATLGIAIAGLGTFVFAEDGASRVGGLLVAVFGVLYIRVVSEVLIIVFRFNETLTDIKKNTDRISSTQE